MCGIFGIAACAGQRPSLNNAQVARLRDLMSHRGPDGAGLWRRDNVVLAHRRLAILDLSDHGAQPMVTQSGDRALVYNGELYNHIELRAAIQQEDARPFQSNCDSETALRALELWGPAALRRFRGMFALAWWDGPTHTLTLARDPLGVKPLYYMRREREIIFASEPRPLLEHPDVAVRPNWAMVSAYLTTIRTVLNDATLFEGVHAVAPAEMVTVDLSGEAPRVRRSMHWVAPSAGGGAIHDFAFVRAAVEESVRMHLQSDAPVCALLSGGLDSSITTAAARSHVDQLRTYCAGAPGGADDDDLACARRVAGELGVRHDRAVVTHRLFIDRWSEMVQELGVPLSTPNEVAINAVARRLQADDCVVAISGEGADELFGGYDGPLLSAWQFSRLEQAHLAGGRFQLESNAWIPPRTKAAVLQEWAWQGAQQDEWLLQTYDEIFAACVEEAGALADPVEPHLRFLQRVNLSGLLQRLDTAMMLASVEGRTPFADARVAELAAACPMDAKFSPGAMNVNESDGGVAVRTRMQTKIALRKAFAGVVPQEALDRPKASFPLPFQDWMDESVSILRSSGFAREIFSNDAIETVAQQPQTHWRFAWPMINLARWGNVWWN